ncbi:hypothetical protein [Halobacterium jilantaiense]|uniref:DUF8055 domain-containing protein n=1 Tax=Halobacterium jilantaiense TaxID=355548 RepID=A0A1I0P4A2_9EURY|nr:hypothetical protein [Halobacterium jilantaiense]SEW08829.1 hypothetical protein SAMN04487945_1369 [Halobacterium jilantaiense]
MTADGAGTESGERSAYWERVRELAARAERDRAGFAPPPDPPDESQAMRYLRTGVGPAVSVYVEGRTGGDLAAFSETEVSLLEDAVRTWLGLYARCYGVERDVDVSLRQAAEVLVDTRNVADTAALLTRVPESGSR